MNEGDPVYICALDASESTPEVEGTEPTPSDGDGNCDVGSDVCPSGGLLFHYPRRRLAEACFLHRVLRYDLPGCRLRGYNIRLRHP